MRLDHTTTPLTTTSSTSSPRMKFSRRDNLVTTPVAAPPRSTDDDTEEDDDLMTRKMDSTTTSNRMSKEKHDYFSSSIVASPNDATQHPSNCHSNNYHHHVHSSVIYVCEDEEGGTELTLNDALTHLKLVDDNQEYYATPPSSKHSCTTTHQKPWLILPNKALLDSELSSSPESPSSSTLTTPTHPVSTQQSCKSGCSPRQLVFHDDEEAPTSLTPKSETPEKHLPCAASCGIDALLVGSSGSCGDSMTWSALEIQTKILHFLGRARTTQKNDEKDSASTKTEAPHIWGIPVESLPHPEPSSSYDSDDDNKDATTTTSPSKHQQQERNPLWRRDMWMRRVNRRNKMGHVTRLQHNLQPFLSAGGNDSTHQQLFLSQEQQQQHYLNLTTFRPLQQQRVRSLPHTTSSPSYARTRRSSSVRNSHSSYTASQHRTNAAFPLSWHCGAMMMQCGSRTVNEEDEVEHEQSQSGRSDSRPRDRNNKQSGFHCSMYEDDDCYDSDPETFAHKTRDLTSLRKRDESNKENIPPTTTNTTNPATPTTETRRPSSSTLSITNTTMRRWESPTSLHIDKLVIHTIWNERFTLVLHQHTKKCHPIVDPYRNEQSHQFEYNTKHQHCCRPQAIHLWLERGQQLPSVLIPPKLVWAPVPTTGGIWPTNTHRANSIALLDIHRVLEAEQVAHHNHPTSSTPPLTKLSHALYVITLETTLVMETYSSQERDRLIRALKFVVARMGSMLLVQDEKLLDEFFVQPPPCEEE